MFFEASQTNWPLPSSQQGTSGMPPLSEDARFILERLQLNRAYDAQELRAFLPEASIERVREIMHELWVNRRIERVGHSAWRRQRSPSPHAATPAARDAKAVTPEDLFDHATFADFFK